MENPEEILHSLEEFSKMKPKDIPRELEEYLCFVAKTGDPVYQWSTIKSLFREKLINVITEFYESCPSVEIPPCPNVELFNYDLMKNFILEKLDTFASAPFTVQRICELLTTPRKEYNRIDKYMRALEKNILVVSTTEPGGRRSTENGEGIMNGIETEHLPETSNCSHDINVEEMDDSPSWPRVAQTATVPYQNENEAESQPEIQNNTEKTFVSETKIIEPATSSTQGSVITCRTSEEPYVSIEPVPSNTCTHQEPTETAEVESVTITAIPAGVQKRRNSVEPVVSSETSEEPATESIVPESNECKDNAEVVVEESPKTPVTVEEPVKEAEPVVSTASPIEDNCNELNSASSGIENISPETSTSSPENLQMETNAEPEIVEKAKEIPVPIKLVEVDKPTEEVSPDTTKCSEPIVSQIEDNIMEPQVVNDDAEITSTIEDSKEAEALVDPVKSDEPAEKIEEPTPINTNKEEVDSSEPTPSSQIDESPVEVQTTMIENAIEY